MRPDHVDAEALLLEAGWKPAPFDPDRQPRSARWWLAPGARPADAQIEAVALMAVRDQQRAARSGQRRPRGDRS